MRILSDHHLHEPGTFFPALSVALTKGIPKFRSRGRIISEDQKRLLLTWEAPSLHALRDFIGEIIPEAAHRFTLTSIFDMPGPPLITSVFPFSVIQPNGGVIIQGQNFGSQPGQFLIVGNFPGGQMALTNLQWGDNFAAGVIPWVAGVPDQQAVLQIVTQDGQPSNQVPVTFTAARTVALLPGTAVTPVECGQGGSDLCYIAGDQDPFTVAGAHGTLFWPGGSSGDDVYNVNLANGWVFDHYEWLAQDGINGGPFGLAPDPDELPAFTIDVNWSYGFFGNSNYELAIYVVGPIGMPFH
jgi:hypothetical protein